MSVLVSVRLSRIGGWLPSAIGLIVAFNLVACAKGPVTITAGSSRRLPVANSSNTALQNIKPRAMSMKMDLLVVSSAGYMLEQAAKQGHIRMLRLSYFKFGDPKTVYVLKNREQIHTIVQPYGVRYSDSDPSNPDPHVRDALVEVFYKTPRPEYESTAFVVDAKSALSWPGVTWKRYSP